MNDHFLATGSDLPNIPVPGVPTCQTGATPQATTSAPSPIVASGNFDWIPWDELAFAFFGSAPNPESLDTGYCSNFDPADLGCFCSFNSESNCNAIESCTHHPNDDCQHTYHIR